MFIHTNIDRAYNQNLFTYLKPIIKLFLIYFQLKIYFIYAYFKAFHHDTSVFLFFFVKKHVSNIFATFNIFILHLHLLIYLCIYLFCTHKFFSTFFIAEAY